MLSHAQQILKSMNTLWFIIAQFSCRILCFWKETVGGHLRASWRPPGNPVGAFWEPPRIQPNPTQSNLTQPNPIHCPAAITEMSIQRRAKNPMQSNSIQCNPSHSNPVQSNPIQSSPIQPNPIQSSPAQSSAIQFSPIQFTPIQSNPVPSSPVQSNSKLLGCLAAIKLVCLLLVVRLYSQLQRIHVLFLVNRPMEVFSSRAQGWVGLGRSLGALDACGRQVSPLLVWSWEANTHMRAYVLSVCLYI